MLNCSYICSTQSYLQITSDKPHNFSYIFPQNFNNDIFQPKYTCYQSAPGTCHLRPTLITIFPSQTVREKRKPRQAFLFRVWKFLQVTATGVIKGDSKYFYYFLFTPTLRYPEPSHLDLELPQRYWPSNIPGLCQATG